MSNYIFTTTPGSKGAYLLIYDREKDVFYTAPRHIATIPPNMQRTEKENKKTLLIFSAWIIFFAFAWLSNDFVSVYLGNRYVYGVILCALLCLGDKMAQGEGAVVPLSQGSIEGQERYFTIAPNLQTTEQRQKYLAPFNPIRCLLVQTFSLGAFGAAFLGSIMMSRFSKGVLCGSLFLAFCFPLFVKVSMTTYKDEGRKYLWERFGKRT